jgi:HisJ family histidinol phosphate phosphatase
MADPRVSAMPDVHGHAKGEHRPFTEERPIAYSARMLFLWFYHACRRMSPRFLMVADHANYLTFEDPGAVATVRRALKLAEAGDLLGAAETAGVDISHATLVSEGLRRGMRFAIGAEIDNDPRARPDAQNIVEALRPDGIIRSVHFVPIHHPEKGADWPWPFDSPEFIALHDLIPAEQLWELYTARLFEDIEKLPTHIVGHFYVPAVYGRWPAQKLLEHYEDRLLDLCHARGLAIEVNTRFLYRDHPEDRKQKFLEANARLVRKAKARGVGIAVGSDAHSPKDQGNAFEVILAVLNDAHVNELVFPVAGRLARVALRATQEHLEAQAQALRQPAAPGSSISGYSRAELGLPEESESVAASRSGREGGPKKRSAPPTTSTSRRTIDSTSSAAKAKAARLAKPAATPKKKAVKQVAPATEPPEARKKPSAKPPESSTKKPAPPAARAKKAPLPESDVPKTATTTGKTAAPSKKAVAPGKKALAPIKKAVATSKKAAAPIKKAAAPIKKAAAPIKKAAAPIKKAAAPTKKAAVPSKKAATAIKKAVHKKTAAKKSVPRHPAKAKRPTAPVKKTAQKKKSAAKRR